MIKLSFDIYRDEQHPSQWTARCNELGLYSAGTSPEIAVEAIAEAVRMMVQFEMKRQGLSAVEVFRSLIK